jgi:hypothetical protein
MPIHDTEVVGDILVFLSDQEDVLSNFDVNGENHNRQVVKVSSLLHNRRQSLKDVIKVTD